MCDKRVCIVLTGTDLDLSSVLFSTVMAFGRMIDGIYTALPPAQTKEITQNKPPRGILLHNCIV